MRAMSAGLAVGATLCARARASDAIVAAPMIERLPISDTALPIDGFCIVGFLVASIWSFFGSSLIRYALHAGEILT